MKSVVFTFGRMNPPTTGHQLLVNKLVAYAKQHGAAPRVYLSHSTGKKDPLQYDTKISFARQAFGAIVKKSNARNVIQILQSLEKEKYTDVIMIVGSDRVSEFKKLLNAYNGKEYNFDKITIVSAGERDPDADDVSGMSASKMRALAVDNKDAEFMRGAPSTLKAQTRKQMLTAVRKALLGEDVMDYNHDDRFIEFVIENSEEDAIELPSDAEIAKMIEKMDITDLDLDDADAMMLDLLIGKAEGEEEKKEDVKEARILSGQARQKLSQRMKGMSKRLARLRQLKAKQMPAAQRLRMRARKAALMSLRKRATGKKNLDYNSLSRSQRIAVDTALVQRFGNRLKKAVDVLSKRILPRIRSMAQKNVAKARDMKESNINELFTSNPHLLGKTKEGSPKDIAQDKIQAAKRGISVKDWEKTKADAAHDSPLNVNAQKLNTLDTDPTLNDRAAPNPKQSHLNVNRKLMHYSRNDEAYVQEARRGASGETGDAGDTNIIYQMRKSVLARGQHEVDFADGSKHKISVNDANKLMNKFNSIRMPREKQLFTIAAGKSLKSFKEVMLHGAPKEVGRKVSLGGKQFKEFYTGVGRARTVSPYDRDEPPGTRNIGEASTGGVDSDANDNPNKPRKANPKLDLLLRLGLADSEELQKYRRALRTSKKQALQSPEMRNKLADLLDKLIELTTGDAAIYSRARTKVITTKEAYSLLRKSNMSGIDANVIAEVYVRGLNDHDDDSALAFDRVNSFIAGGMASLIDGDLSEKVDLPQKYRAGLSDKTAAARKSHWDKMSKYSDRDSRAYQPAPGDATAKTKLSKHTLKYKKMYGEEAIDEAAETGLSAKAKKSGVSIGTLRKVYNRGVAAWNSGHRPGTTPQQWGMARVNSYITKGKGTYHGADKDLHEDPVDEACWDTHKQVGMKMKGGRQVPNCVPKSEAANPAQQAAIAIAMKKAGKKPKTEEAMDEATNQQKAAGAALATQRGEYAGGKKGGAVNRMALMKTKDLVKLARNKKMNEEDEQVDEAGLPSSMTGKYSGTPNQKTVTFRGTTSQTNKKLKDYKARGYEFHKHTTDNGKHNYTMKHPDVKEEAEQVDEISSKVYKSAMNKASNRAMYDAQGTSGPRYKKYAPMARKFQAKGIEQEKKEKSKVNENFDEAVQNWTKNARFSKYDTISSRGSMKKGYVDRKHVPYKADVAQDTADRMKDFLTKGGTIQKVAAGKKTIKSYVKPKTYMTPNKASRVGVTEQSTHALEPKDTNEINRVADVRMVKIKLPDGRVVFRKQHSKAEIQHETYTGSEPTSSNKNDSSNRFVGTDAIRKNYASVTPGQTQEMNVATFAADKPSYDSARNDPDSGAARVQANQADASKKNFSEIKKAIAGIRESNDINKAFAEATYKGKTVPLNKPMAGDVKKSKVYVDPDGDGKAKKVNFGDKKLSIKKGIPARKKSYCARSGGQGNLTNKSSANYWSRRAWDC